jgi:hypothetical protein
VGGAGQRGRERIRTARLSERGRLAMLQWMFSGKKQRSEPEDTTERLERLEKLVRSLEIEWNEVYDKFRQLHMRVAKRVQRLDQAEADEAAGNETGETEVSTSGVPSTLSPRLRTIQQQILERRNRAAGGGGE